MDGQVEKSRRMAALNTLYSEKRIRMDVNPTTSLLTYELIVEEQSPEDLVLAAITEFGTKGSWIRDIRKKVGFNNEKILKNALKGLESKKLIRPVKSISNRKLYILANLQPDESVTGGACYESGAIRDDIVKNLKSTCFQYFYDLYEQSYKSAMSSLHSIDNETVQLEEIYASAADVFAHLRGAGVRNAAFADINLSDVEHILSILSYECKLNKMTGLGKTRYRYNPYNRDKTDMFYVPCMICPLYKDCKPGSVAIGPEKCQYLSVVKFSV